MKISICVLILHSFLINVIYAEGESLTKPRQKEIQNGQYKEKGNPIREFDSLKEDTRKEYVKLRNKAEVDIQLHKPFTALLALESAESIFKKDIHLHNLKGSVYAQIHLFEEARKSYLNALSYNEEHINSLMNLLELNFLLQDYKKVIYWYGKITDVIGKRAYPLIEYKHYIAVTKMSKENRTYIKLRQKLAHKYTNMDDTPYYYVLAVGQIEQGNKEEALNQIYSAIVIFNDAELIKRWNNALEDSSYLHPSDIILSPKVKKNQSNFTR